MKHAETVNKTIDTIVANDKEDGLTQAAAAARPPRSKINVFTFWLKTMWKMRSIYSSFAVHIFDVNIRMV